ncbi:hypothetical protein D3C76_544720 [compost metagenome]
MDSAIKAGQTISVALPADTPQYVLTYLNQLKSAGERTYHRKIAQLFMESVREACSREQPYLLIPLPNDLSEEQQDWFNHPYTRKLLAQWVYQLVVEQTSSTISTRPPETTPATTEPHPEHKPFEISTSYHSKLVGYFMNDD